MKKERLIFWLKYVLPTALAAVMVTYYEWHTQPHPLSTFIPVPVWSCHVCG